MFRSSVTRIPSYISARSPLALRRLMLANNLRQGGEVHYFDIQFAQGKWWAWFFIEVDKDPTLFEITGQVKPSGEVNGGGE